MCHPPQHTPSHPDTAPSHSPLATQAAPLLSELSQEPPSLALTLTRPGSHVQLQGALLWDKGPRPSLPAKHQPWVGSLHRRSYPSPACPCACWSWDIRMRAQPTRTCLSCLHRGCIPALASLLLSPPCSSPFSGSGSGQVGRRGRVGGRSMSGCLSICLSVVECSPFSSYLSLFSPGSLWAFQGPGPFTSCPPASPSQSRDSGFQDLTK